jgi:hypothetical protein
MGKSLMKIHSFEDLDQIAPMVNSSKNHKIISSSE